MRASVCICILCAYFCWVFIYADMHAGCNLLIIIYTAYAHTFSSLAYAVMKTTASPLLKSNKSLASHKNNWAIHLEITSCPKQWNFLTSRTEIKTAISLFGWLADFYGRLFFFSFYSFLFVCGIKSFYSLSIANPSALVSLAIIVGCRLSSSPKNSNLWKRRIKLLQQQRIMNM